MRRVHIVQIGIGLCVGLLLGSIVTASAAHLGTLAARDLGASATVVAGCDPDGVSATWDLANTSPVWSPNATMANSTFNVTRLRLEGVAPACNGQGYSVTIANSSGVALRSLTGTVSGAPTVTFTFPATDSKLVAQIVVLMYG